MSEWISVKDSMPIKNEDVDIYSASKGRITDVCYDTTYSSNEFYDHERDITYDDATHWMVIPNTPSLQERNRRSFDLTDDDIVSVAKEYAESVSRGGVINKNEPVAISFAKAILKAASGSA